MDGGGGEGDEGLPKRPKKIVSGRWVDSGLNICLSFPPPHRPGRF